jgi:hypothetical protein
MAERMAYIARHTCGKIVAATVADLEHKESVAEFAQEVIMDDCTIHYMTLKEAQHLMNTEGFMDCECGKS